MGAEMSSFSQMNWKPCFLFHKWKKGPSEVKNHLTQVHSPMTLLEKKNPESHRVDPEIVDKSLQPSLYEFPACCSLRQSWQRFGGDR